MTSNRPVASYTMAVSNSTPSDAISQRLNDLLHRAREVKQSSSIEPPLQVSSLAADNEPLFSPIHGDKEIHTLAFERAAKNIFYNKLGSAQIQDPAFVHIWNLLDILQYCGDRGTLYLAISTNITDDCRSLLTSARTSPYRRAARQPVDLWMQGCFCVLGDKARGYYC